jgi:DICT domain-containing protein
VWWVPWVGQGHQAWMLFDLMPIVLCCVLCRSLTIRTASDLQVRTEGGWSWEAGV